jgi:carboxypeptidase family protein
MQMTDAAFSVRRSQAGFSAGLLALSFMGASALPVRADRVRPLPAALDTIRGIVFDSLLHQPIPDATVQSDAGAVTTMTDREGRFTLISPQPIHRVTVFHDFLDRTGLGSLAADVTEKTSHSMMVLSTPSLATIWSRLCAGLPLEKGRGGIVFGSVRAADGTTRLAGAQVRVSWDYTPSAAGVKPVRTSDTKTDATGSYYACGAPPNYNVYVMGYSKELTSGAITIPGDTLPLRRVDIVLGEFGKSAVIRGVVTDPRKAPLAGASIDVVGVDATSKTDAGGHFALTGVPTGSRTMEVRAVGFAPMFVPITVLQKQNEELDITMLATALPGVNITGRQNVSGLQLDFEQRKREGFGTFKDSTEIVKTTSIRSIFQGIPSLVITGVNSSSFGLFTPGQSLSSSNPAAGCPANVYIDGKPSDLSILISLSKEQIAAIEVYIRQEFAPAQYLLLSNNCGVVLVWTKLEFKKK